MTGQRSTGTRRPIAIPPWWQLLIAITALAVLATAGLVAYAMTRPAVPAKPTPINITITVAPAPVASASPTSTKK